MRVLISNNNAKYDIASTYGLTPPVVGADAPVEWRAVQILGAGAQMLAGATLTDMVITLRELPQARIDPSTLTADERLYLQHVLGRPLNREEHITLEQAPSLFSLDGAGTLLDPVQPNGAGMLVRQDMDARTFFALMKMWNGTDTLVSWLDDMSGKMATAWTNLVNDPAILALALQLPTTMAIGQLITSALNTQVAAAALNPIVQAQFQIVQDMVYNAALPTIHTDVVGAARIARRANLQRIWPFNPFV